MSRTEEKRAERRKAKAAERAVKRTSETEKSRTLSLTSDKGHFVGKVRKGDAVTVEFFFSGLPVPFDEEREPDKGIVERTEALRDLMESAEKSKPS